MLYVVVNDIEIELFSLNLTNLVKWPYIKPRKCRFSSICVGILQNQSDDTRENILYVEIYIYLYILYFFTLLTTTLTHTYSDLINIACYCISNVDCVITLLESNFILS